MSKPVVAWLLFCSMVAIPARTDTVVIRIDATRPGPTVNPRMYGIFLEEINHGVDGGLYAELIRNRAFEDGRPPEGYELRDGRWVDSSGFNSGYDEFGYEVGGLPFWRLVRVGDAAGSMHLETSGGISEQSAYCLRLDVGSAEKGRTGVANVGHFRIGLKPGARYRLSLYVRAVSDGPTALEVQLEDADGVTRSDLVTIDGIGDQWQQYTATLTATHDESQARLVILACQTGQLWLDFVSLFPEDTWLGRCNGLRADIAQMIADLQPGFVRFPGGCIVEGGTVETAYNWKETVGPLIDRTEKWGPWHYRRTQGMGFHEYLQFCEDLGAEPLWVGFAGQTCIFRQCEKVPLSEMEWVRDNFLNLVEYANAPPDSHWGAMRAAAGHPEPFHLKYIEIGNENAGPEYEERFRFIWEAPPSRYPDLTYLADMQHAIEMNQNPVGRPERGTIESERWYDIKIALAGRRIRCYLDGELIHDAISEPPDKFFATAGRTADGGLVVKAINLAEETVHGHVVIDGGNRSINTAGLTVLTSDDLADNNSLDEPTKVAPH